MRPSAGSNTPADAGCPACCRPCGPSRIRATCACSPRCGASTGCAHAILGDENDHRTLRQFLRDNGFTSYFEQHFVTPLVAAVWSTAPDRAGDYPARYLFSFLQNHGMLQVTGSPIWYTVVGGSARYVERAAKGLTAVQTSAPVRSVERTSTGVAIRADDDSAEHYDGVGARDAPAPGARACSIAPTALEHELLTAHRLHRQPDAAAHRRLRAADRAPRAGVVELRDAVVYCAARVGAGQLQHEPAPAPRRARRASAPTSSRSTASDHVDPATVIDRMSYEHPVYTTESVAARTRLPELNDGVLAFAGAYHGWGFHEDGARSGVDAAASLGVEW